MDRPSPLRSPSVDGGSSGTATHASSAPTKDGATETVDARPHEDRTEPEGATFPPSVVVRDVPEEAAPDDPTLFFNRELSTVDFNWRVLHQALDDRTPLLERVFFTAITGSNLDEFFRKRVGGLKRQAAAGVTAPSPDGRTPQEQLSLIRTAVERLYGRMNSFWSETLVPRLRKEAGVHILDYEDLTESQRTLADDHFQENVFPVLTPLAVDPGHPFPFLSNLSLSLAVMLHDPRHDTEQFARVKVPANQDRWVALDEPHHFVPLEQVIAHNLDDPFRGMEIQSVHTFRVTRNADMRRDEEEANDLLEMISEELRERRFAPVVRLEVDPDMPDTVRSLLKDELSI